MAVKVSNGYPDRTREALEVPHAAPSQAQSAVMSRQNPQNTDIRGGGSVFQASPVRGEGRDSSGVDRHEPNRSSLSLGSLGQSPREITGSIVNSRNPVSEGRVSMETLVSGHAAPVREERMAAVTPGSVSPSSNFSFPSNPGTVSRTPFVREASHSPQRTADFAGGTNLEGTSGTAGRPREYSGYVPGASTTSNPVTQHGVSQSETYSKPDVQSGIIGQSGGQAATGNMTPAHSVGHRMPTGHSGRMHSASDVDALFEGEDKKASYPVIRTVTDSAAIDAAFEAESAGLPTDGAGYRDSLAKLRSQIGETGAGTSALPSSRSGSPASSFSRVGQEKPPETAGGFSAGIPERRATSEPGFPDSRFAKSGDTGPMVRSSVLSKAETDAVSSKVDTTKHPMEGAGYRDPFVRLQSQNRRTDTVGSSTRAGIAASSSEAKYDGHSGIVSASAINMSNTGNVTSERRPPASEFIKVSMDEAGPIVRNSVSSRAPSKAQVEPAAVKAASVNHQMEGAENKDSFVRSNAQPRKTTVSIPATSSQSSIITGVPSATARQGGPAKAAPPPAVETTANEIPAENRSVTPEPVKADRGGGVKDETPTQPQAPSVVEAGVNTSKADSGAGGHPVDGTRISYAGLRPQVGRVDVDAGTALRSGSESVNPPSPPEAGQPVRPEAVPVSSVNISREAAAVNPQPSDSQPVRVVSRGGASTGAEAPLAAENAVAAGAPPLQAPSPSAQPVKNPAKNKEAAAAKIPASPAKPATKPAADTEVEPGKGGAVVEEGLSASEIQTTDDIRSEVVEGAPALIEPWVEALLLAAKTLGVQTSPEQIRSAAIWSGESDFHDAIVDVALSAGLTAQFVNWHIRDLSHVMLPALIPISSKYVGMIVSINDDIVNLVVPIAGQLIERSLPINQLRAFLSHPILIVRERDPVRDGRLDDFMTFKPKTWLRDIFINNKGTIFELCVGSLFGNLLAIGTSLFAMQVWDRVVPARSTDTLWVLASGVVLALIIEFCIRSARVTLADHFGKRADLRLSALFFARALDIKSDARPKSPGTLISQLRDLDQMRELLTSTTMGVIIDLPFVVAFLFIMWMIGGVLVWVPIAAIPILIIPGLIMQYPLSNLADKGLSEVALRNALLMETVHRVEDIKILQAEPRFRNLWNKVNRVSADISMKQRFLGSLLINFTSTVQQIAYIGVVIVGVYGIMDGDLTFGSVLACSILTSRTIAPLGQVSAVFTRLQNARVSKKSLDGLLSLPVDHDQEKDGYHKPNLVGSYRFDKVAYGYNPEEPPILTIPSLKINPGEKIAILGRVGAGKSTLLRLAGGLAQPMAGRILFNGINMNLIDVADIRRDIGFLMQDASLFYGTLRDNLLLGNPLATDEEILEAMHISCASQLLLNQPHGLDLVLREGGKGLSGGQKQTLMLARLILRSPNILLLDEPTASLDEATEAAIIQRLGEWLGKRTMLVATHRYSVLSLVDRIIVVEGGRVVLDGPKDEILNNLKQNPTLGKREEKIANKSAQTRIEKSNG